MVARGTKQADIYFHLLLGGGALAAFAVISNVGDPLWEHANKGVRMPTFVKEGSQLICPETLACTLTHACVCVGDGGHDQ
jgi:hypothetical protein